MSGVAEDRSTNGSGDQNGTVHWSKATKIVPEDFTQFSLWCLGSPIPMWLIWHPFFPLSSLQRNVTLEEAQPGMLKLGLIASTKVSCRNSLVTSWMMLETSFGIQIDLFKERWYILRFCLFSLTATGKNHTKLNKNRNICRVTGL